jgi:hypothetical protein
MNKKQINERKADLHKKTGPLRLVIQNNAAIIYASFISLYNSEQIIDYNFRKQLMHSAIEDAINIQKDVNFVMQRTVNEKVDNEILEDAKKEK